jgi:hypothetical protein
MLRWLLPTLLLTLTGAPFGLQQRLDTGQVRLTSPVQLVVPEPVSGNPAPLLASSGPRSQASATVVERARDDTGLNADARRPSVILDVSKDQVDQNEGFTIYVTGRSDGDGGVAAIWWWATGTSDPALNDVHVSQCSGTSTCSGRWQVSTDDGLSEILIHARARDQYGRDADEVTRDIWVR